MRALCVLVLAGATFENGRFADTLWNLTYEAPGLSRILAPGNPAVLFTGRCPDGIFVEITALEGGQQEDGAAWRKRRRAAFAKSGRKLEEVSEGDTTFAWLLATELK